jgi:hypothetical protein
MTQLHLSKILSNKNSPIILLACIAITIGLLVAKDYGVGVDEPNLNLYGTQSLDSYKSWLDQSHSPNLGPSNLRYYGPAFLMLVELAVRLIFKLGFDPNGMSVRHYSYFLVFIVGVICLYQLSCRWLNRRTSFLVALLFLTQPLLIGHAFINPKDSPFMSLFIICVYFGFRMIDSIPARNNEKDLESRLSYTWLHLDKRRRINLEIIALSWIGIPLLCYLLSGTFQTIVFKIVEFFYHSESSTWYGKLFLSFASQAGNLPVENYANKVWLILNIFRYPAFVLFSVILLIILQRIISIRRLFSYFIHFFQPWFSIPVITAGILIGFTTSVRVIGPFAGLMIAVLALIKHRQKSIPYLMGACLWAILICYCSWPFLWAAPINNFISSLSMMSAFPFHGTTLFNGVEYFPYELPLSYIPVLMSLQFTEPIVILFCTGVLLFFWQIWRRKIQKELFFLVLLWFIFPCLYFVFSHSRLYDNFRQILFIIPPIFFLVGLSLENMLNRIRSNMLYLALACLLLLPGVYSIIKLHPYEYTYYNSFIGGTRGAFRRFDLDYWRTSFSELAKELNRMAPQNSTVIIWRAMDTINQELRSDLVVGNSFNPLELDGSYDYALLSSRWGDDALYPGAPVLATVEREGAIFSVLKFVKGSDPQ